MSDNNTNSIHSNLNISGYCPKCGKPYVYVGDVIDTHSPPYCTCPQEPSINPSGTGSLMYGWVCPVCGAALSPFTTVCNHGKLEITFNSK